MSGRYGHPGRGARTVSWLIAVGCLVLAGCTAGSAGAPASPSALAGAAASAGARRRRAVAAAAAGPLGEGGSQGTLCSPVAKGQVLSDGFDPLMNSGRAPATIEAVSLADPHHLVLLTAYVVPITGGFLYGVHAGFPPAPALDPGVLWSDRQPAVGATVPHTGPDHLANLLLIVKPTASTGSAAGVLIAYRAAGQAVPVPEPGKTDRGGRPAVPIRLASCGPTGTTSAARNIRAGRSLGAGHMDHGDAGGG